MVRCLAVTLVALAIGCSSSKPEGTSALREAQKARAAAAKDALLARLSSRLKAVIETEGPAAAVRVCATEAIAITRTVGEAEGVAIGRTSARLRNPSNTGPGWARKLIEAGVAKPTFEPLADGKLGALYPIRLKTMCETCHGDPASFSEELRGALAEAYPDDRATGFSEGDLRGWFWVEVPVKR